jgi:hypothetical protein
VALHRYRDDATRAGRRQSGAAPHRPGGLLREVLAEPVRITAAVRTASDVDTGGFELPIVKDKAFAFGAFTISRRTTDLMSLLSADSVILQRLGTDPALVDCFLSAMNGFGIPATRPDIPRDALVDHAAALIRGSGQLCRSETA